MAPPSMGSIRKSPAADPPPLKAAACSCSHVDSLPFPKDHPGNHFPAHPTEHQLLHLSAAKCKPSTPLTSHLTKEHCNQTAWIPAPSKNNFMASNFSTNLLLPRLCDF